MSCVSFDRVHAPAGKLLNPEMFSGPRTAGGRRHGEAEHSVGLSIETTVRFQVCSSRGHMRSVGRFLVCWTLPILKRHRSKILIDQLVFEKLSIQHWSAFTEQRADAMFLSEQLCGRDKIDPRAFTHGNDFFRAITV